MIQQTLLYARESSSAGSSVPQLPSLNPNVKIVVDHDNNGQIAVGNNILQIGSNHGNVIYLNVQGDQPLITARPRPIARRPRPFPNLIGRQSDIRTARGAIQALQPVEFYAESGMGKTALLQHLSHQSYDFPDGLVFLSAFGQTEDELQEALFDAFYDSTIPVKLDHRQLLQRLHSLQALIVLDDNELSREQVEMLLNAIPSSAFLLASNDRRLWGTGRPLALGGLQPEEGVVLFVRELGRPLTPEEQLVVCDLVTRLGGHPFHILQAAAQARDEEDRPLAAFVATLPAGSALQQRLLRKTGDAEQHVIATLAGLNGAPLHQEHLSALLGQDAVPLLQTMSQQGFIQANEQRQYRLAAGVPRAVDGWELNPSREWLARHLIDWSAVNRHNPSLILRDADAIRTIIQWADEVGRPQDVVRLARAIEGPLALGKRWSAWADVLRQALESARATNAANDEAWALHQWGTRAFGLGERAAARSAWQQALVIRRALGDQVGSELTRYHLDLLRFVPPSQESSSNGHNNQNGHTAPKPQPTPEPVVIPAAKIAGLNKLLLLLLALFVLGSGVLFWWLTRGNDDPPIMPTPPVATLLVVVDEPTDEPTVEPSLVATIEPTAMPSAEPTITLTPLPPTPLPTTPLPNLPLQIHIAAPADGLTVTERDAIIFSGTADDPEDGNLAGNLIWSSNLLGVFGRGPSLTATLPVGVHVVTASVNGYQVTDTVQITVIRANPNAPVVTITSPSADATFRDDETITLAVRAQDAEDGDLSDRVTWILDSNRQLGSGASLVVAAAELGRGSHTITATVNDSGGLSTVASQVLTIVTNQPPTLSIARPKEGESFDQNFPLVFEGQAIDLEEGDLSAQIVWQSDRDGELFRGNLSERGLSPGPHTVTATVSDGRGATQQASVTILVTGPPDLVATMTQTGPAVVENGAPGSVAQLPDIFKAPVRIVVENRGWEDAGTFYIIAVFQSHGTLPVPLVLPGVSDGYITTSAPLGPGETMAFDAEIWLSTRQVSFGETVQLWVTADSCLPDQALTDPPCLVEESDETNNNSNPIGVTLPDSNFPPEATIVAPDADTSYNGTYDDNQGAYVVAIDLIAEATDAEDGALPDSAYVWTTNRSDLQAAELGTGKFITASLYTYEACKGDEHVITVTVTDSDGNVSTASVTVIIYGNC